MITALATTYFTVAFVNAATRDHQNNNSNNENYY